MNKKRLEQEYKKLQIRETPDLWDRIESGLTPREAELPPTHPAVKRHRTYQFRTGLAAAACCILALAGIRGISAVTDRIAMNEHAVEMTAAGKAEAAGTETMEGIENIAGIENAESMVGNQEIPQETVSADQNQGIILDIVPETFQTAPPRILSYDSLPLTGTAAPLPDSQASYTGEPNYYFTEDCIGDTELLCKVKVSDITYEPGEDGLIHDVIYEISVEDVLYAEDYVSAGQSIQVKSPLMGSEGQETLLYGLKQGGSYILPLKNGENSYELVFPYAPQIEVTSDTRYLFHNGWQSLINEETSVVVMTTHQEGDDYYDRMLLRYDDDFLPTLIQLAMQ